MIYQDDRFMEATQTYCERTQRQYGLEMKVVIVSTEALAAEGMERRHTHYVMAPGNVVVSKDQFDDRRFEGAIEALLE